MLNNTPQMLEYFIIGKQKFLSEGNNKIENICNKNTSQIWTSTYPCSLLQINLRLKTPNYVICYQIRVTNSPSVTLIFKNQQGKVVQTKKLFFTDNENKFLMKTISIKQKINFVDIILSTNSSKQEVLGLVYFIIKGTKSQTKPQKTINNLSINDHFSNLQANYGKKTLAPSNAYSNLIQKNIKHQKDIFQNRQKQKQPIQKIQKKSKYQQEDSQLQKALLQSQKQYRRQTQRAKRNNQKSEQQLLSKMEIQSENTQPLGQDYDYELVKFKQIKKSLMNVNHKWLQAQRQAEQEMRVKQQHKLSNYLQVRLFWNISFYIMNSKNKIKLQGVIQQLGGKILKEPKEYCYLIALSKDQKVRKAIQIKGVKAINQNFIFDCKKCNALLQVKDYLLRA